MTIYPLDQPLGKAEKLLTLIAHETSEFDKHLILGPNAICDFDQIDSQDNQSHLHKANLSATNPVTMEHENIINPVNQDSFELDPIAEHLSTLHDQLVSFASPFSQYCHSQDLYNLFHLAKYEEEPSENINLLLEVLGQETAIKQDFQKWLRDEQHLCDFFVRIAADYPKEIASELLYISLSVYRELLKANRKGKEYEQILKMAQQLVKKQRDRLWEDKHLLHLNLRSKCQKGERKQKARQSFGMFLRVLFATELLITEEFFVNPFHNPQEKQYLNTHAEEKLINFSDSELESEGGNARKIRHCEESD